MIAGTLEIQLMANLARLQKDMDSARRSVGGAMTSIEQMAGRATAALGGLAGILGVREIIALTDQYTKFTAQLKLATTSTREYAQAYADVKRISSSAQAELGTVGVLYARIANGTRELGVSQRQVASITETVNLALKVSGASAQESASAQLQLSQAFASGTLRGEEFNAVNEAAPRLMKALADGMGVPIGSLREMATSGLITSKIMADVLPRALESLREETKQVETISGAFTVLKNNVMEFTGIQAQSSGAVGVFVSGIRLLSDNLALLAGTILTVAATKFATWLASIAGGMMAAVAASRAKAMATVAAAAADVEATAAAAALAAARVNELRSAVLAAEGNVALAITTNGLIPAQARMVATSTAATAALTGLTVAQRASSTASIAMTGALGLLGGPIGVITLLLGLGATAWAVWGGKAKDANLAATSSTEASTIEILANLEKQNEKLRERIALAKAGNAEVAKAGGAEAEKMASLLTQINALKSRGNALTGFDQIQLIELTGQYAALNKEMQDGKTLSSDLAAVGQKSKAAEWAEKYANNLHKMNTELALYRKEVGAAADPQIEKAIRDKYAEKKQPASVVADGAGTRMLQALRERGAEIKAQVDNTDKLSNSEREMVKFQQLIADLKEKKILTSDQKSLVADKDKLLAQLAVNVAAEKALALKVKEAEEQKKIALALDETRAKVDGIARSMSDSQASQREQYDRALSVMGLGSQAAEEMESTKALYREYGRFQRELNEAAAKNNTLDSDYYRNGSDQIRAGLQASLQDNKDYYDRLKEMQGSWSLGASEGLANYYAESRNVFSQTERLVGDASRGMEDAMVDAAMTGKFSFGDMAKSIIADIVRIQSRQANAGLINLIGDFFGGGAATNFATGSTGLSDAAGSLFSATGADVMARRAVGGPVAAGGLYRVNEYGPEVLDVAGKQFLMMGADGGNVTANRGASTARSAPTPSAVAPNVNIYQTIHIDSRTDQGAIMEVMGQVKDMTKSEIQREIRSGSRAYTRTA